MAFCLYEASPLDRRGENRLLAAQMRRHATSTGLTNYITKFEQAAAELERKAEKAEHFIPPLQSKRLDS